MAIKKKEEKLIVRFANWKQFDFILGSLLSFIICGGVFSYFGGATFRDIARTVAPAMPYIILFIVVYFCISKAMTLMMQRQQPLLDPVKCKNLSFWKILLIGIFGNLGSIALLAIAVIIVVTVMATMNPAVFNKVISLF